MTADLPEYAPADPRTPARYVLAATGGRFRWTLDGAEVASAAWRDHCWDLREGERGAVVLSVVGGSYLGRTRICLVDHPGRRTFTFAPGEPVTRALIGTLADSSGAPVMLVKADGPTGLHVVDPVGGVLALTSRRRSPASGCDVLVLPAGADAGTPVVLGLSLALELLRAGALRSAA